MNVRGFSNTKRKRFLPFLISCFVFVVVKCQDGAFPRKPSVYRYSLASTCKEADCRIDRHSLGRSRLKGRFRRHWPAQGGRRLGLPGQANNGKIKILGVPSFMPSFDGKWAVLSPRDSKVRLKICLLYTSDAADE